MDIDESLSRLNEHGHPPFSELFYRTLLGRFPDLDVHFIDLDMMHQGAVLSMALSVIVQHYHQCNRGTDNYLKVLGHRHYRLGITRHNYDQFREAMMHSLQEFHGDAWAAELVEQWSDALENATDTMLRGHTNEQIVF